MQIGSQVRRIRLDCGVHYRMNSVLCVTFSMLLASTAWSYHLEMSPLVVNGNTGSWQTVSFLESFPAPPIVVVMPEQSGSDPANLRIRNVTGAGFEVVITEPSANDGPHVSMSTAYLAVSPGVHALPGGNVISAFTHATSSQMSKLVTRSWDDVSIPGGFASSPTLVASLQTQANETANPPLTSSTPFLNVAIRSVSSSSMRTSIERSESAAGSVTSNELIGFVAMSANALTMFTTGAYGTVQLQSRSTARNIRGWDDGCFSNTWLTPFTAVPLVVASMNSRQGGDGGWLRQCGVSSTSFSMRVDEDIDNDSERSHTNEQAGAIGASTAFHFSAVANLKIVKSIEVVSDAVTPGNPKSIPGSVVVYRLRVSNEGFGSPDANSVHVVDDLPGEIELCVSALCFLGAPVALDDGSSPVPSGLSVSAVQFSNDGGATFGYTPSAGPQGYDPQVQSLRVSLSGAMASATTAGNPYFDLLFRARLR